MKYGSKERTEKNSLGKFGLGLKTASTAFAKILFALKNSRRNGVAQGAVGLGLYRS